MLYDYYKDMMNYVTDTIVGAFTRGELDPTIDLENIVAQFYDGGWETNVTDVILYSNEAWGYLYGNWDLLEESLLSVDGIIDENTLRWSPTVWDQTIRIYVLESIIDEAVERALQIYNKNM